MSLDFSYKNVHDYEAVSTHPMYPDDWHPIGNALVWMSMVCGYNQITEANAVKIAQRLMEYQAVIGPLVEYSISETEGPRSKRSLYIDIAEVRRFIGLRTNASSMTDREWNKKLLSIVSSHAADLRYGRKVTALEQFEADCKMLTERKAAKAAEAAMTGEGNG